MAIDSKRSASKGQQVVLDVEDARDIGPIESDGLLRECIALTQQRLNAALARTLDQLQAAAPEAGDTTLTSDLATRLAGAVRRERARFLPHFNAEFDRTFAERRAGQPRKREARKNASVPLALVAEGDLSEQVALRSAVHAMRAATQEVAFGFDLRVRLVMREQPAEGKYENPWNSDYVCDAVGNTCRALWPEVALWRPIMERMVRELTAPLTALHRELNALVEDRDILPELRVRTRARGGDRKTPELAGDALFGKLMEMYEAKVAAQPSPPFRAPAGADFASASPLDFGNPAAWRADAQHAAPAARSPHNASSRSALIDALNLLQRGRTSADLPAVTESDAAALRNGAANELPALKEALAGRGSTFDRVTIEIVAALLDEVFDDRYLPAEIKTVFGRLQIPILKAALLDPRLLGNSNHRVRRFLEALATASVGLRPDDAHDVLFIGLADHLATIVRDQFADDLSIFETARDDLATFLDAERAGYNKRLAEALPSLLAQDEYAAAETEARAALAARLAQRDVPAEIRAFLDYEGVERLASAYVEGGPEGGAWKRQVQLIDDLLWSIARESGPAARKRLMQLVPQLVRAIREGWATDAIAQARREALLARLYDLHVGAMKAVPEAPPVADAVPPTAVAAVAALAADAPQQSAEDQVAALIRGDWCVFRGAADEATVLAKLAWRAPHDTSLLFTYRDGATAFVHTPRTLAEAFGAGRATVAVEAVPLFERAIARVMEAAPAATASM